MTDATGTKLVETIARLTARIAELETEGERRAEEIHKANVWIREGGERIAGLEGALRECISWMRVFRDQPDFVSLDDRYAYTDAIDNGAQLLSPQGEKHE